jgi:hypothetical protein
VVAGARFALDTLADRAVEHVRRPRLLVEAGMRWTTKIVLFPSGSSLPRQQVGKARTKRRHVTIWAGVRRPEPSWSPPRWNGGRAFHAETSR